MIFRCSDDVPLPSLYYSYKSASKYLVILRKENKFDDHDMSKFDNAFIVLLLRTVTSTGK